MPANRSLKTLRESRNVTVRQVELESRRIADAKSDMRFYISNGWLAKLENDPPPEPSIWKLFSLSAIYRIRMTDLMRFFNVDEEESDRYYVIADPTKTQLLSEVPEAYRRIELLKSLVKDPDNTSLLPQTSLSRDNTTDTLIPGSEYLTYGFVGLDDFTMYPLIRPRSFVTIDTRQNHLTLNAWRSEYERPIYFVELRDRYACGWCELQGNQLLIIPHHSSPSAIRRFTYPKDAEIIGRVTCYYTDCVDRLFDERQPPEISSR